MLWRIISRVVLIPVIAGLAYEVIRFSGKHHGNSLVRAIMGPTVFDRVMAANMFGTKTVLLIAVSGFLSGRPEWLDLALLYALMNFIGTVAVLKFTRFGDLAGMEPELDDERTESEPEGTA